MTSLLLACSKGHFPISGALLETGAEVHDNDIDHRRGEGLPYLDPLPRRRLVERLHPPHFFILFREDPPAYSPPCC